MAVLNVRVDDHVRDQLKEMADAEGVTLSEHVRDILLESVLPVYAPVQHGEEPAPESMRTIDRQVLALLHRVLARVLPEDANGADGDKEYQLARATILEEGFTGEYWREVAGFSTELSKRDCDRVLDILQMFRIITFSVDHHRRDGTPVSEGMASQLEFRGFDHNDALERHMADYVKYQVQDDRWSELQPQIERHDRGNSHSQMLGTYLRMLTAYRRIMDARERGHGRYDYLLTLDDLQQITDARIHPSHR